MSAVEDRLRARIGRARVELPGQGWSVEELRLFADFLDSIIAGRRRADAVGNVAWLADRR